MAISYVSETSATADSVTISVTCPRDLADAVAWDIAVRHFLPVSYTEDHMLTLFGVSGPSGIEDGSLQKHGYPRTDQEESLDGHAAAHLSDLQSDTRLSSLCRRADRFRDVLSVLGQHTKALPRVVHRVAELASGRRVVLAHLHASPSPVADTGSVGDGQGHPQAGRQT
jgi:hypothetical protein